MGTFDWFQIQVRAQHAALAFSFFCRLSCCILLFSDKFWKIIITSPSIVGNNIACGRSYALVAYGWLK